MTRRRLYLSDQDRDYAPVVIAAGFQVTISEISQLIALGRSVADDIAMSNLVMEDLDREIDIASRCDAIATLQDYAPIDLRAISELTGLDIVQLRIRTPRAVA